MIGYIFVNFVFTLPTLLLSLNEACAVLSTIFPFANGAEYQALWKHLGFESGHQVFFLLIFLYAT